MPIPATLQSLQATASPNDDTSHPGWGADIHALFAAFRHAENGYPRLQCDTIDDCLRADAKLTGMVAARNGAVTGAFAWILPGGSDSDSRRAADMLRASIAQRELDLQRLIEHQQSSTLRYGYALTEQVWEWNAADGHYDVAQLHFVHTRNTGIATSHSRRVADATPGEILVQVGEYEHAVARQIPNKYVESRASNEEPPSWAGLGVISPPWSKLKMQAMAGYLTYVDRYGLPFLEVEVGDWDSKSDQQIARDIVRNFGRDAAIVRPRNASIKVTIHDGAQGSRNATGDLHDRFIERVDQVNGTLWNGSPYATQSGNSGSSYALASQQSHVEWRLVLADRYRLQRDIERQWFARWMRFNGLPGRTPKLNIFVERVVDPQLAVKMAGDLAGLGYNVDPEQLMEMTGLRRSDGASAPEEDDEDDDPT